MEQPYTNDPFDQWRLSKVGGSVGFKSNGKPVFKFQSWEQYQQYMALNAERQSFEKEVSA